MYNKKETIKANKLDQLQICLFALIEETISERLPTKEEQKQILKTL